MGDIHGNLRALRQCLNKCQFDYEFDTLIQLGDVSDRHPYTAEVVEELFKIQSLIALRGNHDIWTRDWLLYGNIDSSWMANGGFATMQSYERNTDNIDIDLHKSFFYSFQKNFYVDAKNRVFIHGGFTHTKGPQFESDPSICAWDRSLWRGSLDSLANQNKPYILENFFEVYLGHTPTLNWKQDVPMNAFNIWNIDTGAGTTGKLTIMNVDTKEYWQSD